MSTNYFQEFKKLLRSTPQISIPTSKCENCDYNVMLYASKNSYLCKGSSYLEDSFYCDTSSRLQNCTDVSSSNNSELCYECINCARMYNSDFCQNSTDCNDCYLCYDCRSCSNCFGCAGLRHKEYHIFNKAYSTKEAYQLRIKELKALPREEILKEFENLKLSIPCIATYGTGNDNSTGDHMQGCKNCIYTFDAIESENCIYAYNEIIKIRDSVDVNNCHNAELCYDTGSIESTYNCNFIFWSESSRDSEYCYRIISSKNCFMCCSLRQKEYHILNKPYSPEEYHKKVKKIKEQLKREGLYGKNLLYLALEGSDAVTAWDEI